MLVAELITIGDELLIGQVVDTNSAWMGEQLNLIGIKVKQITSISDDKQAILTALKEAQQRADIVLVTGGLGPTKDDITKTTLCEYFQCGYRFDENVHLHLIQIFQRFGRTLSELNKLQAQLPELCTTLFNANGTAPGMWFENQGKVLVSMPGVPYEMKGIMKDEVLPRLQSFFKTQAIFHKTILTMGIGESYLSELISDWEDALPSHIKLAYLPSPGYVRLRLTGTGNNQAVLESEVLEQVNKLKPLISTYIFGYDSDTLPKLIHEELTQSKRTISTAESCTGGTIAAHLSSLPGSSTFFIGSVVAYSNQVKEQELGVSSSTLEIHGAVSEETVNQMISGALKKFGTYYSIAISGIAGPDGGSDEKPVGTVWIGVGDVTGNRVIKKYQLGHNRERNIQIASLYAINQCLGLIRSNADYKENKANS
ncbi:MAG: competence/damage-inducible protein A [Bacteroidia bacterium]|nr:competence/damage-inducible protein A [Bacteroidia bacterium]